MSLSKIILYFVYKNIKHTAPEVRDDQSEYGRDITIILTFKGCRYIKVLLNTCMMSPTN